MTRVQIIRGWPGKVRELKLKFSYLLLWLQSVAKELINNPFIFILQSYGTWTYMGFTWVILLFHIQLEVRLSRRSRMELFFWYLGFRIFLVAQVVKNLPAMQETWVWSLGHKDPLEKGMAFHSRILPWRIPGIEEPEGLQFMGSQRVRHNWATNTATLVSMSGRVCSAEAVEHP